MFTACTSKSSNLFSKPSVAFVFLVSMSLNSDGLMVISEAL